MKTIGLITANYVTEDFRELSEKRTLATVPFGGRYRLIDFVLSNMSNSGITTVGVIAPYHSSSLIDHVGIGKPWNMDRKKGGLFIMPGSVYGLNMTGVRLPLKDLLDNKVYLDKDDADNILFASASTVSNMDYTDMIREHEKSDKDITVAYRKLDAGKGMDGYFITEMDEDGTITSFAKKAEGDSAYYIDCMIIKKDVLLSLIDGYANLEHKAFMEIVAESIGKLTIGSHEWTGYVGKIETIADYWRVSRDMLNSEIRDEIFGNPERIIYTKVQDETPTVFKGQSKVKNSLIATGSEIEGTVENSIIFRSVHVAKDAVVKNCIIMQHSQIAEGAYVEGAICDKYVKIGKGITLQCGGEEPIIVEKGKTI